MHKIYIIKDNYNNDLKGFNLVLSISLVGIAHNFYSGCLALNSIHHINYIEQLIRFTYRCKQTNFVIIYDEV